MATVVLDAYSKAYPSITNRIRASVYSESDPLAIVASIIDAIAGHPSRIWHFPGLPRDNYKFSLDEIDGGGNPINNLALFDVVPGQIDGTLTRPDEQPQVGITPGFVAGTNTFTFDGTGGKPNYIGWDIVPSELTGRGILVRGLDYSWDSLTGILVLLQPGDLFPAGLYYNIHFEPIASQTVPDSIPTIFDFSARVITANDAILVEDFGNSIIVEPGGQYIELTLPPIATVPKGRILSIETIKLIGTGMSCVKIIPDGSDIINFMDGSLFMMNNETLQIWKLRREDLSVEWRVRLCDGNFKNVGMESSEDLTSSLVYCKHLLDGAIESILQYARIYNQHILRLPGTQVVNFDDWATGNNKYLYSLANSANPSNANKFHFPDRRALFERNNNSGKAGDYSDDMVKISALSVTVSVGDSFTGPPGVDWTAVAPRFGRGFNGPSDYNLPVTASGGSGTETVPKNYLINKFVLV